VFFKKILPPYGPPEGLSLEIELAPTLELELTLPPPGDIG